MLKYLVPLCLYLEIGCSSVELRDSGVKSFTLYQARRQLESLGKHELRREYKHPGMMFEEYEERQGELHGVRSPTEEMMIIDGYVIDCYGHLHLKRLHEGVGSNETKINIPLRIGLALNLDSVRVKFSIDDFDLTVKTHINGDYRVMLEWGIKF